MKIIKNYDDLGELSTDAKKIIYFKIKTKVHQKTILDLLPSGKSVWIDSNGSNISSNIIAFENIKWKGIFNLTDIKYYRDFYSQALSQVIKKYIKPSSIVIYQSCEFRYINEKKLIDNINFLIKSYPIKLLIYIDTVFIDFNKLKYSNQCIMEKTRESINQKSNIYKLDDFKYIFEIN
jgi:hypothetical protein